VAIKIHSFIDGPEKVRFLTVRGKIYKRYTVQQKSEDQVASLDLKRSITQLEEVKLSR
jgi:hypothetical protein